MVFEQGDRIGAGEFLLEEASFEEIVHETEVPNLHVIPRGVPVDQPNELLASTRMDQLLDEASENFDIVIIDTPPSGAISDAVTLSKVVDGIVMVVKHGAISRHSARQTLDRLRKVNANIIGVVLNNVDLEDSSVRYYYYGYQSYTYGYDDPEESEPDQA